METESWERRKVKKKKNVQMSMVNIIHPLSYVTSFTLLWPLSTSYVNDKKMLMFPRKHLFAWIEFLGFQFPANKKALKRTK